MSDASADAAARELAAVRAEAAGAAEAIVRLALQLGEARAELQRVRGALRAEVASLRDELQTLRAAAAASAGWPAATEASVAVAHADPQARGDLQSRLERVREQLARTGGDAIVAPADATPSWR